MAEASILVAKSQFICSICLDLLKNPVTIPCGHSYCMNCITDYWNYMLNVYSCPQCRQTFTPRPVLNKNVVMAEMVENIKIQSNAGPGDVECDVCSGKKCKAVKSCLVCLESYCQTHFERHEEFHSGRRHKVTDATGRLKEIICSKHDKQLEIYCRTDQCCICYLCTMDEHRNHDTVAAVMERTEKQKQLEDIQRKFQQKIQDRKELKEALGTHGRSVQTADDYSQRILVEPVYSTQVTPVKENNGGLLGQLEQEIEDLKMREAELKKLSITKDHIHFLQCFQSLVSFLETLDGSVDSSLPSSDVPKSVSELKEKLKRLSKEEDKNISGRGEAAPSPSQRSQHPLPSLQAPPLRLQHLPSPIPSCPLPPLRIQHPPTPPPSLQAPPLRSQRLPQPIPTFPLPSLGIQHPPTPPPSLQAPPLRSQRLPQPIPTFPLPPLRIQHPPTPPPSLQAPPLRSQHLPPPIPSLPLPPSPPPSPPPPLQIQHPPTPPLQLPPAPPPRSQNPPRPLPSLPTTPSTLQHLPTQLQSLQSTPAPPARSFPLTSPIRSQQPHPLIPPSLRSQQPPTPRPKPLRLQFPLLPALRSQNSVESPLSPQLPPSLRSQNSVESSPPLLPPSLRSQNSVEQPPPLPPPLRSQHSVDSPPPLPPPIYSQNSPPPLPPYLPRHR